MRPRAIHLALPKRTGRAKDRDSSVALINIVFLLLVFMMLAGTIRPILPVGFKWAETSEAGTRSRPYGDAFVDRDGKLWREGVLLNIDDVAEIAAARARRDGAMRLLVDRAAETRELVRIVNVLRSQGVARVDLTMTRAPRPDRHAGGAPGQP